MRYYVANSFFLAYPQQCDSQSYGKSSQIEEISDDVARKLESIHVHKVGLVDKCSFDLVCFSKANF